MEMLCCTCKVVLKTCNDCSLWWPIAALGTVIAVVTCVICCVKYSCYKKEMKCFISQKEERVLEKKLDGICKTLEEICKKMH